MLKLCTRLQHAASTQSISKPTGKYDIFASVAIFRAPIVAPEMNETQKKFAAIQKEIEAENAYKSDFELRRAKDLILLEKKKQLEAEGKDLSELEGEIGITSMMQEDEWIKRKEAAYEKYGISKHAFEHNDNAQTLSRYLDRKLMLLVKQKFENSDDKYASPWILPQLKNSNESLRQTAERCLGEIFISDVNLRIYGNAPIWHITYKYPKKFIETAKIDTIGGKVFVFQCLLESVNRDPKINIKWIKDFKWSTADEISELVISKKYQNCMKHVLFE